MQKDLAKDGVVCLSVSLDELSEAKTKDKVLTFLQRQNARFPNYILDETSDDWQKRLEIDGAPLVRVYGKDGKLAKSYKDEVDHDEVERFVKELIKK